MATPALASSFELADYTAAIRRRWRAALAVTAVFAVATAGYYTLAPRTYSAPVLVQVAPLPNNTNVVGGRTSGNVNMDNEAQLVTSDAVTRPAAAALHSPSVAALARQITVAVPPNTSFLQISCQTSAPQTAATCANAVAAAYLRHRRTAFVSGLHTQLNGLDSRISSLAVVIGRYRLELKALPMKERAKSPIKVQLSTASTELKSLQQASNALSPYLASVSLSQDQLVGEVATPATPPAAPASPRAALVLPSGLVAGLLAGLMLALALDWRDRRIHAARDVERYLQVQVLLDVTGPQARYQPELFPPRTEAGQAFAELSGHVTGVIGEGSHTVLVAATSAGTSGSVTAANLAAALAWRGSEVALICADRQETVTSQLLGVSGTSAGLSDVLSGQATASQAAQHPDRVPGLTVITPGAVPSGAPFSREYENLRGLLSELHRTAGCVIIEARASGPDAAAFTMAELADAAVLTVETSRTTRPGAAGIISRLTRLHATVLGAAVVPPARAQRGKAGQPKALPQPPGDPAVAAGLAHIRQLEARQG